MNLFTLLFVGATIAKGDYASEYKIMPGHTVRNEYQLPLPHNYLNSSDMPDAWNWADQDGKSLVTKSLNQHLPQYCGSCWAHGALSALADRIKIARKGMGSDINLAIQYILNCGGFTAGSCHGGSHTGTYQFIKRKGYVPYDTCLQYEACSKESNEGTCAHGNYECNDMNTCRTCSTFSSSGGKCTGMTVFPNASIAEYGTVSGADRMKAEIYARGPIACTINAEPLLEYQGGVYDDPSSGKGANHIVSIIGWEKDVSTGKQYWIVRNSWGEYWGELGYVRLTMGQNQLGIEDECAWATPKAWTEQNFPCYEDGSNCVSTAFYTDPSVSK